MASESIPQLTPPQSSTAIELQAPAPAPVVEPKQADGMVKIDPLTVPGLDAKVAEFVNTLMDAQVHDSAFEDRLAAVHNLGAEDIRAAASVPNRLLQRPVAAMQGAVLDDKSPVSRSLIDLRHTVEELDPSRQGDLFSPKKLLGMIPVGNRVREYFAKYESAQGHLNAIITTLYRGQDELRKDNAAIEQEKVNLWEIMQRLQQYIYLGKSLDSALAAKITTLEATDPEKARVVKEEMLFAVRQQVQDLLTQLAVSIQGYLALDIVRKNNQELVKGIDRATTTTVAALRTAVIVAQALANQKLVLDQISALNTTTGSLIESTSVMLKQQSAQIGEQAASSTVSLEKLQAAFNNIYETMDAISTYKVTALDAMQQTVDTLSTEVEKSKTYLDRVRQEQASHATSNAEADDNSDKAHT